MEEDLEKHLQWQSQLSDETWKAYTAATGVSRNEDSATFTIEMPKVPNKPCRSLVVKEQERTVTTVYLLPHKLT